MGRMVTPSRDLGYFPAEDVDAAIVNPAFSLLEWRFNYREQAEESGCRGLRANAAHGRVGAVAAQHRPLPRAGPRGGEVEARRGERMFSEPLAADSSRRGGCSVGCSPAIPQSPGVSHDSRRGSRCTPFLWPRALGVAVPVPGPLPAAAHLRGRAGRALPPYQMGHDGNILFLLLEEAAGINSN